MNKYTINFLKALGKDINANSINLQKKFPFTLDFAKYLESKGVDITKFTDSDLRKLMTQRKKLVETSLPKGKSPTIDTLRLGNTRVDQAYLHNNGNQFAVIEGRTDSRPLSKDSSSHISSISNKDDQQHKVSETLYNTLINWVKKLKGSGIISGEELVSPEKTYKVWEHYPNKKLISKTGEHKFGRGKGLETNNPLTITDGPVYLLNEPSDINVPTKHLGWFHPNMIDENGIMKIPDWMNPDVLKIMFPPLAISTTVYGLQNNKNQIQRSSMV